MKPLKIGDLAEAAEVPVSTLRYYERENLLAPTGRSEGNYRLYDADAVERVRFIRVAQSAGFRLEDIAALLAFRDGNRAPCAEVEELIDHRLDEIRLRLKEMKRFERQLRDLEALCHDNPSAEHCRALDRLERESAGGGN